jgi:hypothetical protein
VLPSLAAKASVPRLSFGWLLILLALPNCGSDPFDACDNPSATQLQVPLVSLDFERINTARACRRRYAKQLTTITSMANRALHGAVVSVLQKTSVAPSGDVHDYYSLARYAWPDPNSPTGLPYVTRDGEVNPEVESDAYDKHASDDFFTNVNTLGLAYFYTRDPAYAERVADQIRAWLIDPDTRMNPSVLYASVVRGVGGGRSFGVIEMSRIYQTLDAFALISDAGFQSDNDRAQLRSWMADYGRWLEESEFGQSESATVNNHSLWYDVQRASIGLFLGQRDAVAEFVEGAKLRRIDVQIAGDGELPNESWRADSWAYTCYALRALIELAQIGKQVGVDLWSYESPHGGSIRRAIDRLVPYALHGGPFQDQAEVDPSLLYELLRRAAIELNEPAYESAAEAIILTSGGRAVVDLRWPMD